MFQHNQKLSNLWRLWVDIGVGTRSKGHSTAAPDDLEAFRCRMPARHPAARRTKDGPNGRVGCEPERKWLVTPQDMGTVGLLLFFVEIWVFRPMSSPTERWTTSIL